ncbi:MAG: glycosyltransferase involved in cell wall biosynthesis [Bacteroidia bacterium]|jgi:glycosyltransferase involved in cell wall biosynthesis
MATASADAPLKGLRYLLKAYARLLKNYPDLELLLVSKPQPGGKTEKLVDSLGIVDKVKFVSGISTEQMVRYYAEATIAVIPSVYEGFGLPAGEAMACGVPVVSSDGGALPEVVGDAGVIVPAKSVRALEQAIADLLEDPERRAQLSAAGRARIVEEFCWQVCAKQMTQYYEQVLNDANG